MLALFFYHSRLVVVSPGLMLILTLVTREVVVLVVVLVPPPPRCLFLDDQVLFAGAHLSLKNSIWLPTIESRGHSRPPLSENQP